MTKNLVSGMHMISPVENEILNLERSERPALRMTVKKGKGGSELQVREFCSAKNDDRGRLNRLLTTHH